MSSFVSPRYHLDLPPKVRQLVKTQNPMNGELSYGIVSQAVLPRVLDRVSHLKIAAKCVGKLDLARRLALHLEQSWAGDNDSCALSTGDCNVQAV